MACKQFSSPGQNPYAVAIFGENENYGCAGSILTNLIVITAAHCLTTAEKIYVYIFSKFFLYRMRYKFYNIAKCNCKATYTLWCIVPISIS